MIYIRRIEAPWWQSRRYEVKVEGGRVLPLARADAHKLLWDRVGIGDAWALIEAADRAWKSGEDRWVSMYN